MWSFHKWRLSDVKRIEVCVAAAVWMNLENIILSGISQSQKDKYCITPFTGNI